MFYSYFELDSVKTNYLFIFGFRHQYCKLKHDATLVEIIEFTFNLFMFRLYIIEKHKTLS